MKSTWHKLKDLPLKAYVSVMVAEPLPGICFESGRVVSNYQPQSGYVTKPIKTALFGFSWYHQAAERRSIFLTATTWHWFMAAWSRLATVRLVSRTGKPTGWIGQAPMSGLSSRTAWNHTSTRSVTLWFFIKNMQIITMIWPISTGMNNNCYAVTIVTCF